MCHSFISWKILMVSNLDWDLIRVFPKLRPRLISLLFLVYVLITKNSTARNLLFDTFIGEDLVQKLFLERIVWASLSRVVVGGHVLGIVCGSAWTWLIFYLVILTERLYVITYRTYSIFSPHKILLLSCALENTILCRMILRKHPFFDKNNLWEERWLDYYPLTAYFQITKKDRTLPYWFLNWRFVGRK